jgi:hypothetical protein
MKKQTEEPGLHLVGPNPWDNPAKGQRVGVVDAADGNLYLGERFVFNEEVGNRAQMEVEHVINSNIPEIITTESAATQTGLEVRGDGVGPSVLVVPPRNQPQMSAPGKLAEAEELAANICEIRGVDLTERPDLRYLAQRLIDRYGWGKQ